MANENTVVVVNACDEDEFSNKCEEQIQKGYALHSSSCGFIDSAEYDYCNVYNAIFVKKDNSEKGTK